MSAHPSVDKKSLLAAVMAIAALAAALGFGSPSEKLESVKTDVREIRAEVKAVESRVMGHDIRFAEQARDIGYIMDGIDDLRGLSREERKARRRDRRGSPQ